MAQLLPEDRQEHFQARAVREGKEAQDIAKLRLLEAGFDNVDDKARHPSGIIEFNFLLTSPDAARQWWVDVSGAFTTSRPGLQRTDTVWKLLGRLHVLTAMSDGQDRRDEGVLVLTSNLPKTGSPGDRALHAIGPGVIFDAIELYDPAGLDRLRRYAESSDQAPLPRFWLESELSRPAVMVLKSIGAYAVRRSDPEQAPLLADAQETLNGSPRLSGLEG